MMRRTAVNRFLGGMLLAWAGTTAMAAGEKYYVNVQLAVADIDEVNDSGIGVIGTLGVPVPDVSPYFALEGELGFSLVDPSQTVLGTEIDVSYTAFGAYAALNYPLDETLSVRGRMGLVRVDFDATAGSLKASDADTELAFGGGVSYKLDERMAITGEITVIDDLSHLGGGVRWNF